MKKILVVAHDAGGAEVIAAYVKKNLGRALFSVYVAGPARKIFAREKIRFSTAPRSTLHLGKMVQTHQDASFALIAAPGWMTRTESNALDAAKRAGVKTIVYMDSWGHERERFGYPRQGWQKRLPDELWAGDTDELANLRKAFPGVPVRLERNQYIENIKRHYRAMKKDSHLAILFLSDVVVGSESVLDEFLSSARQGTRLVIRFHPADKRSRYDAIIKRHPDISIEKSKENDIAADLAKVRAVVGLETAAMAAALAVGKMTICLAHFKKEALLPQKKLIRLRRAKDAAQYIFNS